MSLPNPWVERIFLKLSVTYGQAFLRQYDGVDMADVKANWGHELSGFQQHPDAIRYGLENLPPDRSPSVLQFKEICRRTPSHQPIKALPLPPVNPVMVEKVKTAFKRPDGRTDSRDWATKLKEREEAGEILTLAQRNAWREAMRAGE